MRKNWILGLVSEAKLGCCKFCGSKFHRGWQCRENPKLKNKTSIHSSKSVPASSRESTGRVKHKPKSTRSKLIKDYDALFSRYLRTQAELNGQLFCFTCGRRLTYSSAIVMHYISRRYIAVRFNEDNVHIGCIECNTPDKNQPAVLAKYASLLGPSTVARLDKLKTQKVSTVQLQADYEALKAKYKALLPN